MSNLKNLNNSNPFKKFIVEWGLFVLIAISIFGLCRLYIFGQISSSIEQEYAAQIPSAFLMGLRFDIKIATIFLSIFVLLFAIGLIFSKFERYLYQIQRFFLVGILVLFFILSVCNIFYYQVYGHQFDIFVFGIVDEDTKAVLNTIWQDFPVIWLGIFSLLFGFVIYFAFSWLHKIYSNKPQNMLKTPLKIVYVFAIIFVLFIGMRNGGGDLRHFL